ncbi:MAG: hypothetical protein ACD_78C00170G0001, partial [uncultured bacterium (gcode 4)]
SSSFTDRESKSLFHRNWCSKFDSHLDVISRHNHFHSCRKLDCSSNVSSSEIELWFISLEEWSMSSTFIFCKYVYFGSKLRMWLDRSWFCKNLSSFNLLSFNTSKKKTSVISSLTLVKKLVEHLDSSNSSSLSISNSNDFDSITYFDNSLFDLTSNNRTSTFDGEYILNRHDEWLVKSSFWDWYVFLDSFEKFENSLRSPCFIHIFWEIKSDFSRTTDNRKCISRKFVLSKKFTDFHFNEIKHFCIIYHITLIHKYHDVWNTYLTSKKDVLTSLCHRSVSCSNDKNRSIHLSSTSNHVFYIIGMSWTVNVGIMTSSCCILDVSSINSNTTCLFFWSCIDFIESSNISSELFCKNDRDSCGSGSLTMIYVSDGTNIYMWFGTVISCHNRKKIIINKKPINNMEKTKKANNYLLTLFIFRVMRSTARLSFLCAWVVRRAIVRFC